jgi:sulfate/thiosulfate transport system substrate-binding protein
VAGRTHPYDVAEEAERTLCAWRFDAPPRNTRLGPNPAYPSFVLPGGILKWDVLRQRGSAAVVPLFIGALLLFAVWPWLPLQRTRPTRTIIFYGFSILGDVMNGAIFPAFEKEWEQKTGQKLEIISSFAASGTVTNQLILGVPAEIALLSLELDAQRLATSGLVPADGWRQLPHSGVLNRTPFIIVVREGNPKGIAGFSDLGNPGVQVVHPDPLTSGGANWAIVAEYGAGSRPLGGGEPGKQAGKQVLSGVWKNVVAQAASARAARTQFDNGFGDALITYEQEPLWDRAKGKFKGEIVYPPSTVLSEHVLVVVDRNVRPQDRELVDAFVQYLWTEPAQRLFVEYGFRSVEEPLNSGNPAFGRIADPFLIADLGGWRQAKREVVDDLWRKQVLEQVKAK